MAIKKATATYKPVPPFERVPDFLTKQECDFIIAQANNDFKKLENTVYSESSLEIKMIQSTQLPKVLRDKIENIIQEFYSNYNLKNPVYVQDFQVSRYKKGASRSWHIDGLLGDFEDNDKPMNFTNGALSFVFQLNDAYEGGRLVFNKYHNLGNLNQNIGDLFVFPSFVWHEIEKVTKGKRYSLTIFTGTEIPLMYAGTK